MKQTWIGVIRGGHFWGRAVHCARGWGESVGMLLLALAATASLPARANIAVGSSGQAAYSMPIGVPPGIAGMAPNLSLSYTDGGINGPLGVGWSLQGISTITRCGSTRPIDWMSSGVEFGPALGPSAISGRRRTEYDFSGHRGQPCPAGGQQVKPGGEAAAQSSQRHLCAST